MTQTEMQQKLEHKVREFYTTFFERGAENRFNDLIEQGQQAYPELLESLNTDDATERTDALVALGRLFETHGPTEEALGAVVAHSKIIHEGGMGPERMATLYAIGRSREHDLVEGFIPLLAQNDPSVVNIALFVLGYAKWKEAAPFIKFIVDQNNDDTVHAAIWALGQVGRTEDVDLLLPMLRRGENVEWITGALGDIGNLDALEDLVSLLDNPRTDVRFLAISSIWALLDQHKDRKERRHLTWAISMLRMATQDAFPPVAVFAMLCLAELGEKLVEDEVLAAFNLTAAGTDLMSREAFYMRRDLN